MNYNQNEVIKAFNIYSKLAADGYIEKDEVRAYLADDNLRGLIDQFAKEVQCTLFVAGDYIYMTPLARSSMFHISNESIKKEYLPTKSKNSDIHMLYIAIIILFGEFYDGYQSESATRDFISMEEWLASVNERIASLKEHDLEELNAKEKEFEYNWISIIDKWEPLDDLKVNVKKQDARTKSRISFLNITKNFLECNELITDIGNDEIELTEKAKVIIQRYYMEYEFNRGILDFMYELDSKKEEY